MEELNELVEKIARHAEREGFTVTQYEKEEIKEEIKEALNEYNVVKKHFKQLAEQNIPICFAPSIICRRIAKSLSDEEMMELRLRTVFAGKKVFEVGVTARTIFAETYIDHPDLLPVPKLCFAEVMKG